MLITLIHYFISFFLDSLSVFLMASLFNLGLVSCLCAAVTESFTVRVHRPSFIYSLGPYCGNIPDLQTQISSAKMLLLPGRNPKQDQVRGWGRRIEGQLDQLEVFLTNFYFFFSSS